MKATVRGTTERGKDFLTEIDFVLHEPEREGYYGTGCYLTAEINGDTFIVDVRYEKTTCIKTLAERWIANYFGGNARQVTFH